jgi:hypothetical protein
MLTDENFGCLLFGAIAVLIAATIGGSLIADSYTCGRRASMMNLRSEWGPLQGCMVDVGDRYAPIEYVRIIDGKVSIQGDAP